MNEVVDREIAAVQCYSRAKQVERDGAIIAQNIHVVRNLYESADINFSSKQDFNVLSKKLNNVELAEAIVRIKLGKAGFDRLMRE